MQLSITDVPTKSLSYAEKFNALLNKLTITQQRAVKTLHGPVLVIAGPGTGKTTLLTARLGYLLQTEDDQVQPQNILCLTYTDNAAAEMHHRLLDLIGPVAHRIRICTFHAFCNDVIQHHPQYFGKSQLEAINDLEKAQLTEQMLEALPMDHEFKRLKGSFDFDIRRLQNLFSFMKREDIRADEMKQRINAYIDILPTLEEYRYQNNRKGHWQKGDPKTKDIEAETKRMNDLLLGVELFPVFEERMRKFGRYDFDDMILWVIDAFKKYPELAFPYREQFQYIMVDEYQDTSGAQNEILQLLTQDDIDNNPNIFCVGDDDQSIYEFQGARIENILEFHRRYEDKIKVFVLPENFRSTQEVLDTAGNVIQHNSMRLVNHLPNIEKHLHTALRERMDSDVKPVVLEFPNQEQEEAWIAAKVKDLLESGVRPKDIAVLYYKHKQANSLMEFFAKSKIPYNVKREVNVLDHQVVCQLLYILEYLFEDRKRPGYADGMLFEIMHYRSLGIDPNDMISLAVYMSDKKALTWREAIGDENHLRQIQLNNSASISSFANKLNTWSADIFNLPIRALAEKILNESNSLTHALKQPDSIEILTVINTFFIFLQEQAQRKPRMTLEDLNNVIQQMRAYNVPLRLMRPVGNKNGVTLSTCHGAKGSEFMYVFMMGCTNSMWDSDRGNNSAFRLPPNISFSDESPREETNRRLFYVAITRAKENLFITYSLADTNGKTQNASMHVSESRLPVTPTQTADADVADYMKFRMLSLPASVPVSHRRFVEDQVNKFVMSQSKLSMFLNCPVEFYFRYILNVPFGKPAGMVYGTAVHYALQRAFEAMMKNPNKDFPPVERFMENFHWCMERDKEQLDENTFVKRLAFGEKHLPNYYATKIKTWNRNVSVEVNINQVEFDGIPVSGRIDKIEFNEDGSARVIDYKTDTFNQYVRDKMCEPNEKEPNGGDYWRQMVFYKILLTNHKVRQWNMREAAFEFVEPDKKTGEYLTKSIDLNDEAVQTVKEQIKHVYKRIKNLDFFNGCDKEYCEWCNMVRESGLDLNTTL